MTEQKRQKVNYIMKELKEKEVILKQKQLTCCFTGRRNITDENITFVTEKLKNSIQKAIEIGYKIFISGMAEGADIIAAKAVKELQQKYKDICLIAYLPYQKKLFSKEIAELLPHCKEIWTAKIDNQKGCYHLRNRYMIEHSSLLIAVTDGKHGGGTDYTIKYGQKIGLHIETIYF
ncbi:SLOG family protein [Lachnospiraceae bacterium 46-61]